MPKLSTKLPSYRKHKATGQAVVTLAGKDHYLGPHGSKASKAEYDRVVGEHLAGSGIDNPADTLAVVELLAGFYWHAQEHYGQRSGETLSYKSLIKRLKKSYGTTPVRDFGPLRLKAFRQTLIDAGLSRGYVNQSMNRIRRVWKWGVENELVRPENLEALRAVAGLRFGKSKAKETEPIRPVPEVFIDATIDHCSPQTAAMIELQRLTGMRPGEVTIMRTADINTAGSVWAYSPSTHKTQHRGHTRIVYLGPKAQAIVRKWLRSDLEAYLFQPQEAQEWNRQRRQTERTTPLSCGNRAGTNRKRNPKRKPTCCYTSNTYRNAVTYAIARCNAARQEAGEQEIPHWHPHQLRHNYPSRLHVLGRLINGGTNWPKAKNVPQRLQREYEARRKLESIVARAKLDKFAGEIERMRDSERTREVVRSLRAASRKRRLNDIIERNRKARLQWLSSVSSGVKATTNKPAIPPHYLIQSARDMRPHVETLYSAWHSLNERFFDGTLQLPIIRIEHLDGAEGQCGRTAGVTRIELNDAFFRFKGARPGRKNLYQRTGDANFGYESPALRKYYGRNPQEAWKKVCTTLLHEMIHQRLKETNRCDGHATNYTAETNRIGRLLNIPDHMPVYDCDLQSTGWPEVPLDELPELFPLTPARAAA